MVADFSAADVMDLDTYNVASVAAVQSSTQVQRADLLIDLGGGDRLRLLGMASNTLQEGKFVL